MAPWPWPLSCAWWPGFFSSATGVTQGPLISDHDAHIKRTQKPRCAICTDFEDTTKMRTPSRGTCQGDLAADPHHRLLLSVVRTPHTFTGDLEYWPYCMFYCCVTVASWHAIGGLHLPCRLTSQPKLTCIHSKKRPTPISVHFGERPSG